MATSMSQAMPPVFTSPRNDTEIDAAIQRGMKWMDKSTYGAAQRMLPPMPDEKQRAVWESIKDNPQALQSYIVNLGSKQGMTDVQELDKLAGEYIAAQRVKFGE